MNDAAGTAQAAAGARLAASLLGAQTGFVAFVEGGRVDLRGLHGSAHVDRDDLVRRLEAHFGGRGASTDPPTGSLLATPIRDRSGRVLGLIGGLVPCNARLGPSTASGPPTALDDLAMLLAEGEVARRAVAEVQTDRPLLRAAVDSLPHHFWVTDAEGRYVEQNALDRSVFGDLIGRTVDAIDPPVEIEARWRNAHRRVLEGETVRFTARRPAVYSPAEVEVVMAPLVIDGAIHGQVGLTIDRTERAAIERDSRANRARLADYVDTASDWVWETDAQHRVSVLEGNRPAGSIPDDQVLGRCRWEVVGADPATDPFWRAHRADLEAHRPFRGFVYQAAAPAGHTTWTEVAGNPVFDEAGQFQGYRGTGREITERVQGEARLKASEARLADYLATASDWLWETDAEHRITSLAGFPEISGLRADQVIGRRRWEMVGVDPHSDPAWLAHVRDLEAHRPFRGFVYAYASADRPTTWIEIGGNPIFDAAGAFLGYRGTARNVTERRAAEAALREAHAKLDAMTQSGLIGITAGHGFMIEEANDAFLTLLALDRAALEGGLDWRDLVLPEDVAAEVATATSLAYTGAVYTTEISYLRGDGARVPVLINCVVLDGTAQRWFALVQDLTPMKLAEARIRELAERDILTGLANRHVLFDRLQGDLAERREPGTMSALLLLDLDSFKEINDTLGHAAGDRLLQAVGVRLRTVLRDTDTIARIGGDEFALVLRGLRGPETAADLAEKILGALGEPLAIEGRQVRPAGSIGISLLPGDTNDAAEQMRMADMALYQAKARGGGTFCFFEPALLTAVERRRQIASALETAIASEAFTVALQPKVCLATGARVGYEALVRWRLDGVPIAPDTFIEIAAEGGRITALGRIVRRRACEARARLVALGLEPGSLAVNVHVAELEQPGFEAELARLLETFDLPPERLEVELTETALLGRDDAVVARRLDALRRLGVSITLDDFGRGYASLTRLKRFPVDRLKIDRSIIRVVDAGDAVLVKGIIDLAHTLQIKVVAEGVETAEQLALLIDFGCDFAQGYHLAPPLELDALIAELASTAAAPTRPPMQPAMPPG